MQKRWYTAITEFEVIAPINDIEIVGEKIALSTTGDFTPENNPCRWYSLLHLLDHPLHYHVSKVIMQGRCYVIPVDREKNFSPKFHPDTMKYYKGDGR